MTPFVAGIATQIMTAMQENSGSYSVQYTGVLALQQLLRCVDRKNLSENLPHSPQFCGLIPQVINTLCTAANFHHGSLPMQTNVFMAALYILEYVPEARGIVIESRACELAARARSTFHGNEHVKRVTKDFIAACL